MGDIVYPTTLVNDTEADADQVMELFDAITAQVNGSIEGAGTSPGEENIPADTITDRELAPNAVTANKLADSLGSQLGVSDADTIRRGKSVIATQESRTNSAFGYMPTQDRVQNIVLPTDGILRVIYQAAWWSTDAGAAQAAIFLNGTQLVVPKTSGGLDEAYSAVHPPGFGLNGGLLTTCPFGLVSQTGEVVYDDATAITQPRTLGLAGSSAESQAIYSGGDYKYLGSDVESATEWSFHSSAECLIVAPAATYEVGVQFLAATGSVNARNRILYVEAIGF